MGVVTKPDIRPMLNKILVGDCIKNLRKIPSGTIDVVFADPPYNLQLSGDLTRPDQSQVDGVDNEWDKFDTFAAYAQIIVSWALVNRLPRKLGIGLDLRQIMSLRIQKPRSCSTVPTLNML